MKLLWNCFRDFPGTIFLSWIIYNPHFSHSTLFESEASGRKMCNGACFWSLVFFSKISLFNNTALIASSTTKSTASFSAPNRVFMFAACTIAYKFSMKYRKLYIRIFTGVFQNMGVFLFISLKGMQKHVPNFVVLRFHNFLYYSNLVSFSWKSIKKLWKGPRKNIFIFQ